MGADEGRARSGIAATAMARDWLAAARPPVLLPVAGPLLPEAGIVLPATRFAAVVTRPVVADRWLAGWAGEGGFRACMWLEMAALHATAAEEENERVSGAKERSVCAVGNAATAGATAAPTAAAAAICCVSVCGLKQVDDSATEVKATGVWAAVPKQAGAARQAALPLMGTC